MKPAVIRAIVISLLFLYLIFLWVLHGFEKQRSKNEQEKLLISQVCMDLNLDCPGAIKKESFNALPEEYSYYGFYSEAPGIPNNASFVIKGKDEKVYVYFSPVAAMEAENTYTLALFLIGFFLLFAFAFVFYVFYERIKILNFNLQRSNSHWSSMATTDDLTGCYNRLHLKQNIIKYIEKSVTFNQHVYFAFLDIDFFKSVNDTYGHDVGDLVLQEVAKTVNEILPQDHSPGLYRMGGEEFLMVLYGMNEYQVFNLLKTIYERFTVKRFGGVDLKIGLSIGVTKVFDEIDSETDILKRADTALYEAKKTGRNKMVWRAT